MKWLPYYTVLLYHIKNSISIKCKLQHLIVIQINLKNILKLEFGTFLIIRNDFPWAYFIFLKLCLKSNFYLSWHFLNLLQNGRWNEAKVNFVNFQIVWISSYSKSQKKKKNQKKNYTTQNIVTFLFEFIIVVFMFLH